VHLVFTPSRHEEAEILSDIVVRSKGYWGYPNEKLELWRKDLTVTSEYISQNHARSIWLNDRIIGYFSIVTAKQPALLDNLWLLPEAIGRGIGTKAMQEIKRLARKLELSELIIISDPNAEGFYLHHGAERIGEYPSIPQDRMLPKLRLKITP